MSANDSSPPSLQKFSPPTCHAAAPQTPTLSSSPQSGLSSRLSNGSFSTQSLTNSRGSMHGISFLLQIGLTRETVTIEAQDLSLSAVKDLVCSIVYQKVWYDGTMFCCGNSCLVTGCLVIAAEICQEFGTVTKIYVRYLQSGTKKFW